MPGPTPRPPNVFSARGFDRAAHLRRDLGALREAARRQRIVVVELHEGLVCIEDDAALALVKTDVGGAAGLEEAGLGDAWLLGETDGTLFFATERTGDRDGRRWSGLREIAAALDPLDAHLAATACGLAAWHRTHRHCGTCGAATEADWCGFRRVCNGCGREHFPRTDPAVIVLVHDGERVLLGRNPAWPAGFASVLAGFVEPGESLEDAVAREVREEVGIELRDVEYHSSQPWPFPASVMLGFTALAADDEIDADPEEVVDVRWYSRDDVAHGAVGLPPPSSIARRLIDDWLRRAAPG